MKFSVVVVTYNPKIEKVLFTLKSILCQNFDDFEIIISDDGSKDNCFVEIEQYFKEHHFSDYVLVPHEKNRGTVQNLISALEHAKGKYVRDFGPGDAFYNEQSIQKIYDFMERENCKQCFGFMRGYRKDETGNIIYGQFRHPFDIQAYRKRNQKRILKNLVLYSDNVSGACMCYETGFYLEYLKKIKNYVIYEEDIFQVLSALEGNEMRLMDTYTVLYEMNAGVSTGGSSQFEKLLAKDVKCFYEEIFCRFGEHPAVKKRKRVEVFYKFRNIYVRTLLRMFVNPGAILYLIRFGVQVLFHKHTPVHKDTCFLDNET